MYRKPGPFPPLFIAAIALAGCGVPQPPRITRAPAATPDVIDERGVSTLTVAADFEDRRPVTFEWRQLFPEAPVGAFASPDSATTLWVAPSVEETTTFVLRVTAGGDDRPAVEGEVRVAVVDVPTTNRSPVVSDRIAAPSSAFAGDSVSLSVTAHDPDRDPLTISWSQLSPPAPGVFTGAGGPSVTWRSPEICAPTVFELQVSVSDGRNAPVLRRAQVRIDVPTFAQHVQPVLDTCLGCHGATTPGGGLDLREGMSYRGLVNVTAACGPVPRVQPRDADSSALVAKMIGTACGPRMPPGDPTYFDRSPGLVTRVRSWILAGAAP